MSAQHYETTVNYTVENGLPSNTIYAIEQDSLGYIWLGTNKGLSRFDGSEFINYSEEDGLQDTEVLKFFKDSKQRIWYYTINGQLGYIQNAQLHKTSWHKSTKPNIKQIMSINEYENQIIVTTQTHIYIYLDSLNQFQSDNKKYRLARAFESENGLYLLTEDKISILKSSDIFNPLFWDSLIWQNNYFVVNIKDHIYGFSNITDFKKNSYFDYSIPEKKQSFYSTNLSGIYNAKIESDTTIFIFNVSGIYRFNILNKKVESVLSAYMPTDFINTTNGDRWMTTYHNGLIYSHNNSSIKEVIKSDSIKSAFRINSKIFFQTMFSDVYEKDSSQCRLISNFPNLREIVAFNGDYPVYIGYHAIKYQNSYSKAYLPSYAYDSTSIWISEGELIHLNKVSPDSLIRINSRVRPNHGKIRHFQPLDSCSFLIYNDVQTFTYNFCTQQTTAVPIQSRLNKMIKDENNRIWIGTNGKGIYVFHNTDSIQHIGLEEGLDDNYVEQIVIASNHVWAMHRKGIDLITINPNYEIQSIVYIRDLPGVPRSISKSKNGILATTSSGIYEISDQYNSQPHKAPEVFIDWILLDNDQKAILNDNQFQIPETTEQLQLKLSSPISNYGQQVFYRYKLIQNEKGGNWINISTKTLTFGRLQPGDYTIIIQAKFNNSNWGNSRVIQFHKHPKWHEITWLKWLIAFLTSLLLIAIIGRIRSSIHYRKRLKSEKLFAELSARKAQFKSHFVFNSINSVRNYLLNNDQKTSDDYLVAYSKLMRKMLDVSNKVLIPLNEELELIEYYMSLEQMRLRHQFEYQIDISKDIRTADLKCPAMITQVFVENAIWHGIMPLNDTGFINIFVALQQQDHYVIRITDDGVGFDQNDIKQKAQTSWGTSIVKDKIKLIKETFNVDLKIEIDSKKGVGTEVSITLPVSFS